MPKIKIMMVDDEEEICEITKRVLERTERFEVMFST
jgi:response regulator of citrate/malate metabolism